MADIQQGYTFANGEIVTPAKLHALVDDATISGIVNADIAASAAISDTKLATISTVGKVLPAAVQGTAVVTADPRLSDARTPTTHTHDDRYYTETEMNTLLAGKQASGSYAPATGIAPSAITGTAVITTDSRLSDARTPVTHTHSAADITSGTLANARTTATSANTASAIVARDASNNFSAGRVNSSQTIPKGGSLIFADTFGTDFELRGNSTDDKLFLQAGGLDILEIDCTLGYPVWKFKLPGYSKVGLFKDNPSTALDVNGTITATAFAGPLTSGAVDSNASVSGGKVFRLFEAIASGSAYGALEFDRGSAAGSTAPYVQFYQLGASRGNITPSGVSGVAYNTSSDYRLKENATPLIGGLAIIDQLQPCEFTWKADGSIGRGFIAHELQAVVHEAVTGAKDAVDAEGKPDYQGVDASKLVPYLVSAVQELKARVEALEAA